MIYDIKTEHESNCRSAGAVKFGGFEIRLKKFVGPVNYSARRLRDIGDTTLYKSFYRDMYCMRLYVMS